MTAPTEERQGEVAPHPHPAWYLLMAIPAVLDFWYIHTFGVNVPFADSWNGTLPIVQTIASARWDFAQFWAPHNENRMFFPNLILGLMDSHTGANAKLDMYLTGAIMSITLLLLIALARRTTGLHPLLLTPLAFLLFDWVQVENLLWAFQLAWMLIVACLVLALTGLDRRGRLDWFVVAVMAASVGSFSSLQGLLIWPAGFLFAILAGWSWRWVATWVVLGTSATTLYFWNFHHLGSSAALRYDLHHPLAVLPYLLRLMGAIVPTSHHLTAGLAIVGGSCLVGYILVKRRISPSRLRLPLALWVTGLLFDLLVTLGRAQLAVPASSRYTTYNLLLAAGVFLAAVLILVPDRSTGLPLQHLQITNHRFDALICLVVVAVTVGAIILSFPSGLAAGRAVRISRDQGAALLRDYRTVPAPLLAAALFPPSGTYVKSWAAWLQARSWSVFS